MSSDALEVRTPITGIFGCCACAASGHAAAPPSATSNSRRPMVTVIRPSRARCVKGTIPRRERAVPNSAAPDADGTHAGHKPQRSAAWPEGSGLDFKSLFSAAPVHLSRTCGNRPNFSMNEHVPTPATGRWMRRPSLGHAPPVSGFDTYKLILQEAARGNVTLISVGLLPVNLSFRPSRAVLRPSEVSKSATTASLLR